MNIRNNKGQTPSDLSEERDADGKTVLHNLVRSGDRVRTVTAHVEILKKILSMPLVTYSRIHCTLP